MAVALSDSEFLLDAQTVRELLSTQFPSLQVASVGYLHEGWDSTEYLVNAFVAIFLGAIRWFVSHLPGPHPTWLFVVTSVAGVLFVLVSAPILLRMFDLLLRLAVRSLAIGPIRGVIRLLFQIRLGAWLSRSRRR